LEELDAVKDAIHGYLACISYADAMLGRLLDAIESGPNADNTIVVLWSDHGYHHGEKMDWGKHTLWERTSNVPFLWAGPGIEQGASIEATVSLIDIFPTLVDLCRLPKDEGLDGVSLAGMLKSPSKATDRNVLLPGLKPNEYAVINQQWRYIRYADGGEELYDIRQDPNEWKNLAGNAEFANVKKQLMSAAPTSFAEPGASRRELKLVIEGESFEWRSSQQP
jgi:arylsulfatase A-like enzyme